VVVVGRASIYHKLRGGRIRTRRGAILAIVALQAVVLSAGWLVTFLQVRRATAESVEDLILDENARVADWLADQLAEGVDGPLEFLSEAWERVQQRVETLQLPGDGFACLLDSEGKILCHPDLRRDPSLRRVSLGNMSLATGRRDEHLMLGEASAVDTQTGRLRFFLGGTHYVATRRVPGLDARLVVHQPEAGLLALSSRATLVVGFLAGGAALFVLGLTALSTLWVMRRYDNVLEDINRGLEAEVTRRTAENTRARDALILGLAKLADCRDNETGHHLERISHYSCLLARTLSDRFEEIDEPWIERLRLASSMHDIGKVGVPDSLLLKPGRFTPEEHRRMQTHTTIGADTLIAIRAELGDDDLLDMSIQIALEHHEKWDGTGYPLGLSGEAIALPARIVALADVYDALTSARVYKPAMTHERARAIILGGRGSHFDPVVVDAFLRVEARFDRIRAASHPAVSLPAAPVAAAA
jgi:response regulator RpfG family c-di-GMP phosphodiesterase